jgi:AcrR family transcriptional regulator
MIQRAPHTGRAAMPQIWAESIEQHKRQTIARIIDATVALVGERGLGATSMSQIAQRTGIGRATLYSYFPDVEHILLAWHDQEVDRYHQALADELAAQPDAPSALLVFITRLIQGFAGGHDQGLDATRVELSALSPDVKRQMGNATARLASLLQQTLEQGVSAGQLRHDLNVQLATVLIMRTATAAREQLGQGQADTQQLADETLALLLGGIQAVPPNKAA